MNNVQLIGRLTSEPTIKKTSSGKSVANFNLAVRRDNDNSDFISVVAWEKTADIIGKYVGKGQMIGVSGRISTRNYDGSDGKKVYVTEVLANQVHLIESRKSDGKPQNKPQFEDGPTLDISSDDLPF